ncbi:MAG TPA: L-threonylcarbamoyladenylate synthase, partial [Usitatibacter sp.]|nr:L-threonylcarbamoyladenylate synthase [Usitatibacter sp.]
PATHPLIVHIASAASLEQWASDVPQAARTLAARFWPGPLTMILKRHARIPAIVTGGQETVGVRAPSHRLAQELLRKFAQAGSGAIAAPSANRFGHISPTTAQHVRDEFGSALFVLDGGACEFGLESTIVDLSRTHPVLLRPGAVTRDDIATALGNIPQHPDSQAPRAPGMLEAHYAPRTALALVRASALDAELTQRANVAVLAMREAPATANVTFWIAAARDPARYGRDLYANLRLLDASGAKRILVEAPPETPLWEAVNDRLTRAAAGAGMFDDEP